MCLLPELNFPLVGLYNCSYVLELANVKILLYFHDIVQADSGDSIVKQVLVCLGKCNRPNKFSSDETQKEANIEKEHCYAYMYVYKPPHCLRILGVSREQWRS